MGKLRSIAALILTLSAILFILPNMNIQLASWLPSSKINLGLDLRGGSHLLLGVDFEEYIADSTISIGDSLKGAMRKQKIAYKDLTIQPNKISLQLRKDEDRSKVKNISQNIDPNLSCEINSNNQVAIFYNEYQINQLQDKVIDQSIEIIRMRVDSSGTKEPNIQRQGALNILLQMPGESDPSELKRLLGTTAKLSFHKVVGLVESNGTKRKRTKILPLLGQSNSLYINSRPIITGDHLNNANIQFQHGMPVVQFSLNNVGAKKFGDFTRNNRNERLAIVLDDKILSAPMINDPITTGSGVITGNFTIDSANELVLMLRAGALPTPLKILEERTVGPNLGADSIESGKLAAQVSFLLVILFMIVFYGIMGIFASITLVIALIFIFALLTILQATLTLPGIAGIVLTIGMAVDANVLIYERIREEIQKGSSNLYAVKTGFASAFGTIFDSNLTTLIAAFLLYNFGVGAIKGFAVTLTIGIVASMYTALVITRIMIDFWLRYCKPKTLI